jgi:hypothetical protein
MYIASSQRENEITILRRFFKIVDDRTETGQINHRLALIDLENAVDYELAAHAGTRVLPCPVNVRHDGHVCLQESLSELRVQKLGPRIQMRLEDSDYSIPRALAGGA